MHIKEMVVVLWCRSTRIKDGWCRMREMGSIGFVFSNMM